MQRHQCGSSSTSKASTFYISKHLYRAGIMSLYGKDEFGPCACEGATVSQFQKTPRDNARLACWTLYTIFSALDVQI